MLVLFFLWVGDTFQSFIGADLDFLDFFLNIFYCCDVLKLFFLSLDTVTLIENSEIQSQLFGVKDNSSEVLQMME